MNPLLHASRTRPATALAVALLLSLAGSLPAAAQGGEEAVRVEMETELGTIVLEILPDKAPVTAANFLAYVDRGAYDEGTFHRTVRAANQPNDSVRIAVIQGDISRASRGQSLPPIPLERTNVTGLRHTDGALSMARGGPDSATSSFFLCVGDQPELDFGGRRNPDGQGFAAFGRVVEGMDVVRAINRAPAEGQTLTPPIRIVRVRRMGGDGLADRVESPAPDPSQLAPPAPVPLPSWVVGSHLRPFPAL